MEFRRTDSGDMVGDVADWDDVRRLALALPDTDEQISRDRPTWRVHGKMFVLERPLRARDLDELGDAAPAGAVLGARVESLVAKEALLADDPAVFFTTSHLDGYPMILVVLDEIALEELEELIVEAWLSRAPKRLARTYLETHDLGGSDGL
jgi:hypothetical protein